MINFSLGVDAPINGVYLNSETIDLMSIVQCNSVENLREFVHSCSQLNISDEEMLTWRDDELSEKKHEVFQKYKDTLISTKESIKDRISVVKEVLEHSGIPQNEIDSYISKFKSMDYNEIMTKLLEEHPKDYSKFATAQHRFIASERDQIKKVSYQEISQLLENLSNHNTILIASGRYFDVRNKLYTPAVDDMQKYDFYHAKRELDFCVRNGKHARYHTLLAKQTCEKHFVGKTKDEILSELSNFVKESIDFISRYNSEHQIDGKGIISSVDLFNEIISFDPPYKNIWQEKYGISLDELLSVFKYAEEHKPEGVTYVYNEPFLENAERRAAVIDLLRQIQNITPNLIDTLGTQMHITMTDNLEDIKNCFEDLKNLKAEQGFNIQITEFDMCLPERHIFDEHGNLNKKNSVEAILNYKHQQVNAISQIINKSGIELEGITYWSISDTLDHNVDRTNRATFSNDELHRTEISTRFAGLYQSPERQKEFTIKQEAKENIPLMSHRAHTRTHTHVQENLER